MASAKGSRKQEMLATIAEGKKSGNPVPDVEIESMMDLLKTHPGTPTLQRRQNKNFKRYRMGGIVK